MRFRWPRRNLGSGEQWGRAVEDQVDGLRNGLDNLQRGELTNLQQINGTLTNLTRLVTRLDEQQQALIVQQNRLEQQQDQILDIVKNQLRFVAGFVNFEGPYNISNTAETLIGSFNITVPAGYTNVTLSATGAVGLTSPLSINSGVAARLYIYWPDGSSNFSALRYHTVSGGWDVDLSPIIQRSKIGVSGNQVITVRVVLRAGNAGAWPGAQGGASVNYQAVFSRDV